MPHKDVTSLNFEAQTASVRADEMEADPSSSISVHRQDTDGPCSTVVASPPSVVQASVVDPPTVKSKRRSTTRARVIVCENAATERIFLRNPLARGGDGEEKDLSSSLISSAEEDEVSGPPRKISSMSHPQIQLGSVSQVALEQDSSCGPPLNQMESFDTDGVSSHDAHSAWCRVSSLVAAVTLMCMGTIIVGVLGFAPFFFTCVKANAASTEYLLSETMKGVTSITQNSVSMLPAFVHIITFNFIKKQSTSSSEVTLPKDPETLMLSLLAVLTRFTTAIEFLRFVYMDPVSGLYTTVGFEDNFTYIVGGYNNTPSLSALFLANQDATLAQPPKIYGYVDFARLIEGPASPVVSIVEPWSLNESFGQRWLPQAFNTSGTYFNYVLPFKIDNSLGFCQAGLRTEHIVEETYKLTPALREHGRIMMLDYHEGIVVQNSWGQALFTQTLNPITHTTIFDPLAIAHINDPFMVEAVRSVEDLGGFATVMDGTNTSLVQFKFHGKPAYLNMTRVQDNYGLDLVLCATVLRADFERAFVTARTVVLCVCAGVLVIVTITAIIIACFVVKPLKRLIPALERASALDISAADVDAPGSGGIRRYEKYITEIRDMQTAFAKLHASLKEMKSYMPQAVMTHGEGPDVAVVATHADGNGGQAENSTDAVANWRRPSTQLNLMALKDRVNTFYQKNCTLVRVEMHRSKISFAEHLQVIDIITEVAAKCSGCVEQLGHSHILVSFGAHFTVPIHASRGCQFANDIAIRIPPAILQHLVILVDCNEFVVGNCGANNCNSRVVFGATHMVEISKILWDIDCHVAVTLGASSHFLSNHQLFPVECVQLNYSKCIMTLSELRPVTKSKDEMHQEACLYRSGVSEMSKGKYHGALADFSLVEDKTNPQLQRLIRICQQRIASGDQSPYVHTSEDVYHFGSYRENSTAVSTAMGGTVAHRWGNSHRVMFPDEEDGGLNPSSLHCLTNNDASHDDQLHRGDNYSQEQSELPEGSMSENPTLDAPQQQEGDEEDTPFFDLFFPTGSSTPSEDEAVNSQADDLSADLPMTFKDMDNNVWSRSCSKISGGAFSEVFLGLSEDGAQVAIKCIKRMRSDSMPDALEAEMHMAVNLRHPNIVQYISCCVTGAYLAIFMEYVPGGSLHAVTEDFGKLPTTVARRYMVDILNGLSYLHEGGIAHCDVKPHNMLLGIDGVCKLSDFGSAAAAADLARTRSDEPMMRGTALYMAPEVARGELCTAQSDVYSLGISLLEMSLGRTPWKWSAKARNMDSASLDALIRNDARFIQSLGNGMVEPDIPDTLDNEVARFIRACCDTDPMKRPSCKELMMFPCLI